MGAWAKDVGDVLTTISLRDGRARKTTNVASTTSLRPFHVIVNLNARKGNGYVVDFRIVQPIHLKRDGLQTNGDGAGGNIRRRCASGPREGIFVTLMRRGPPGPGPYFHQRTETS